MALLTGALLALYATRAAGAETKPREPAVGWNFDGLWLTPLIAPGYTPELELFVAAGAMLSWQSDVESPRSSVPASIGYSTTGAIVLSAFLKAYFFRDQFRLDCDLWYKDMPDDYFGVGYDAGRNTPLGDDTTAYQRLWWQLKPAALMRVAGDLFLGTMLDVNRTIASDMNPKMASDPDVISDGPDNLNVGVGSVLRYDSRDFPQNAYRGVFLQAAFVPYLSYHGNHVGYRIFDLDYRQYQTIAREGSTLAWTFRARYGAGEVPWSELGMLGSPFDLRGYRWGRYRDDAIAYTIVEYRFTFARGRQADGRVKLSRHGVVGWLGAGVLGEDYLHLGGVLPNAGVGYRFGVQGRLNARIDLGFGADAQALYVNFTEAY